jgi:hypothetical protein
MEWKLVPLQCIYVLPKTHSKTYLKNIPEIFQEYFKNIHAEWPSTKIKKLNKIN